MTKRPIQLVWSTTLGLLLTLVSASPAAATSPVLFITTAGPGLASKPPPQGKISHQEIGAHGQTGHDLSESQLGPSDEPAEPSSGDKRPAGNTNGSGSDGNASANRNGTSNGISSEPPLKVKNPPKNKKVETKTQSCNNGIRQCAAAQTACTTADGGFNTATPQVTYVRIDGGDWQYGTVSCGPPRAVDLRGGNEPATTAAPAAAQAAAPAPPPVPTVGQIQTAFRSLPFGKPGVVMQPKGQRTAKNLKTYYAADWDGQKGLQPGDISKPVQLLSWSIEFKVEAQDYRYAFGDGSTSGWTASTGGSYPDGDITHTYSETGDVQVKVDARLTGQYRVNGGAWQDIATVADLQDEPSFTLQVRGTKTGLVDH